MELTEKLKAIKDNWGHIKEKDPNGLLSNASSHQYVLHTTEDAKSIEAFEKRYRFELPEEYKKYLMGVSNGGPSVSGPMYALQNSIEPLCHYEKNNVSCEVWLNKHANHFNLDFVVNEEKIIKYLTHKMQNALKQTPPLTMAYTDGGYLFLCSISGSSHYILALNGACKNEVFVATKAERKLDDGTTENYFELHPEVRIVNDQVITLSFIDWIEDAQKNWLNTNAELDKKLSAVKIMWHNFAAWDKDQAVFGAFMHHYQLNETLTENQIVAFEKKHQFSFPSEYRQYLKLVSNGGVGPFYGMYSFENSTIALNSGSIDEGDFVVHLTKHPSHYSQAFPITDEQVNEYLANKVKNPKAQSQPIKLAKDAGGYLFLAEYGCGGYYIMTVNGNGAGEVWYLQKTDSNKLTYEMKDAEGNVTMSGSYGDDKEENYFEIYPELKWNNEQASTVNFLEWIEHKQLTWFAEFAKEEPIAAEDLDNENAYYPLAVGNTWTYKHYSGEKMVTTIISVDNDGIFLMSNSLNPINTGTKKINGEYFSDGLEKGNMQLILKDNLVLGDTWEVKFKANGIDCVYKYTVKEILPSKTVEGKEYKNVAMVELDSCYLINGNLMSMNAFTQTYYAKGVGTILTTTSGVIAVAPMPLLSYNLK